MIPIAIGNERNPDACRDRRVFFNSLLIRASTKLLRMLYYSPWPLAAAGCTAAFYKNRWDILFSA
jgi:hypothetical protein